MTLGGFALAVGILVDNGTVVIENIERHTRTGECAAGRHYKRRRRSRRPDLPVDVIHLYRFRADLPASGDRKISVFAAFAVGLPFADREPGAVLHTRAGPVQLSDDVRRPRRTASPTGFRRRPQVGGNPLTAIHRGFERGFDSFRETYRHSLVLDIIAAGVDDRFFRGPDGGFGGSVSVLGRDFFPQVDAGQMRLHVRAPPGTRIEQTQVYFTRVEAEIRKIVGNDQIDVILDNIGLPYSGINIALSDSATVGPMDGEILVSLKDKHTPTAKHVADLRRELPKIFPDLQFFSSLRISSIRC